MFNEKMPEAMAQSPESGFNKLKKLVEKPLSRLGFKEYRERRDKHFNQYGPDL